MEFSARLNKFHGWGTPDEGITSQERDLILAVARDRFGADSVTPPVPDDEVVLAPASIATPHSLADITTSARPDRLAHAWGKSFPDLARSHAGLADHAPDIVAYPRDDADIGRLLDWAAIARVAVVPYGGGSSVVGGVTPDVGEGYAGTLSLDLQRLDRVMEVDSESRAVRVQAGVLGPELAAQLRPSGFVLRHYPQSYRHSSLGGWIATRAGGHYATGPTHIDDLVESVRVVSPSGHWQTRRLPASGAGPDPNRLVLGSEGSLGVITEAWVRVQQRPIFRAGRAVRFTSFEGAVSAVREIAQSGLQPANLRLLDRVEAANSLVADGSVEILVLGFESADHDVSASLRRALECCADYGGEWRDGDEAGATEGADAWRDAFMRMPFYRDILLQAGVISETFETAVTWDQFPRLHAEVQASVEAALNAEGLRPASVSCRFTHVYADGVAPYFTVLAKGTPGRLAQQWWVVKRAAADAIERCGGTITHHHAVGRDHMPWYTQERPELFGAALTAARQALDPGGIMNPGVLVS